MSGFGLSPWGIGPWGLGLPLSVGTGAVYAAGDRVVRVELSSEPQHRSVTAPGDALNPATWQITVPSTGRVLTVISVAEINPTTYELLTLEEFDSHYVAMLVASPDLRDLSGVPVVPTISATFAGVRLEATSTDEKRTVRQGLALRDIANPPTPNSPVGGTLEITSAGDYKSVEGAALVRKLILRRLVSKPRDFFHLPDYGLGLREKEPLPSTDLVKLKKAIEQQVELEPEVDAVQARVAFDYGRNVLLINLKVRLKKTGQQIEIGLPLGSGGVQL